MTIYIKLFIYLFTHSHADGSGVSYCIIQFTAGNLLNTVISGVSKFTMEMKYLALSRYSFEKFVHPVHRASVAIHQLIILSNTNDLGQSCPI